MVSSTIRLRHEYEMLKRLYHGYPKGHKLNGIPKVGDRKQNKLFVFKTFSYDTAEVISIKVKVQSYGRN